MASGVSPQFFPPATPEKHAGLPPLGRVDVTAPTGVAALNVGGVTVHRFCGMLLGPGLVMAATVIALSFLGDGLCDALDPQARRE